MDWKVGVGVAHSCFTALKIWQLSILKEEKGNQTLPCDLKKAFQLTIHSSFHLLVIKVPFFHYAYSLPNRSQTSGTFLHCSCPFPSNYVIISAFHINDQYQIFNAQVCTTRTQKTTIYNALQNPTIRKMSNKFQLISSSCLWLIVQYRLRRLPH